MDIAKSRESDGASATIREKSISFPSAPTHAINGGVSVSAALAKRFRRLESTYQAEKRKGYL
jgi:hypothetical protein